MYLASGLGVLGQEYRVGGTIICEIKISRLIGSMSQTNSVCKIIMIPEHKMKPLTKNNSIQ